MITPDLRPALDSLLADMFTVLEIPRTYSATTQRQSLLELIRIYQARFAHVADTLKNNDIRKKGDALLDVLLQFFLKISAPRLTFTHAYYFLSIAGIFSIAYLIHKGLSAVINAANNNSDTLTRAEKMLNQTERIMNRMDTLTEIGATRKEDINDTISSIKEASEHIKEVAETDLKKSI